MAMQHTENRQPVSGRWSQPDPATIAMARGLGVVSLALGAMEITGAKSLSRMLGMEHQENLIRMCGAREIVQGVGILSSRDPTMWMWARVAGDALDIGLLARELGGRRPKTLNLGIALASVLGITAMDIYCARALGNEAKRNASPEIDFSKRTGLPATAVGRHGRARGTPGHTPTDWNGSGTDGQPKVGYPAEAI